MPAPSTRGRNTVRKTSSSGTWEPAGSGEASAAGPYFARKNVSRGSAAGDFDNDGRLDLLVTNNDGEPDLLRNRSGLQRWLKFKLIGTHCNRDAVGARVKVIAGGRSLTQEVRTGSSYLSQGDLRLHFGLGDRERADSIEVTWPCGRKEQVASPPKPDRIVTIREVVP